MIAPRNPNYCANVVALKDFVDLPNCDNVKAALIFGNSVIVSKSSTEGEVGLFFPAESQLSKEFLSQNNLYRKPEDGNVDPTQAGFFETHGRVKAVKFRGHKSEGFWLPISCLNYLLETELVQIGGYPLIGSTFDYIGEHEICRKYIPKSNPAKLSTNQPKSKQAKLEDSIAEGQFRLHFDTEQLRRNAFKIKPNDIISISDKWHGTSVVIGKLLVKRSLNWIERFLSKWIQIEQHVYGLVYSSRKVIKAVNGQTKDANHFYSEDIWGVVAKEVEDKIPNGYTIYGEIVGFTTDGSPIQGGYPYGCKQGEHQLLIYRVTSTNIDGKTLELGWTQMQEFCRKYGLTEVPTFFYGKAEELFQVYEGHNPIFLDDRDFTDAFLALMEKYFADDGNCPHNPPKTPAEGVVVRIDRLEEAESFKLKNFRFLLKESSDNDKGEMDLETSQSIEEERDISND